jgi:hypothetical protein
MCDFAVERTISVFMPSFVAGTDGGRIDEHGKSS